MATQDSCPKCSKPRFEGVLDCPYCGVVYDRFLPDLPEDATVEPTLAPDAKLKWDGMDEVYQGPELGDEPAPAAPPRFRSTTGQSRPGNEDRDTLLTRHMGLSLLVLGLMYLLVQAAWNTYLVGVTVQSEEVRGRLAAVVGLDAPAGLSQAGTVRFVGRNYFWFVTEDQPEAASLIVYHRGRLAKERTEAQMMAEFRGWMDGMGVAWRSVEKRAAQIRGQEVDVEIFAVGEEKGNLATLAALAPFARGIHAKRNAAPRGSVTSWHLSRCFCSTARQGSRMEESPCRRKNASTRSITCGDVSSKRRSTSMSRRASAT